MTNKPTYLLVYPVDPQSPAKFGGIESFTRDWLAYAPPEVDLALLGVDIMGRPEIGHWVEEAHHGRRYRFFPVCRMDAEGASNPGKTLFKTTTFRFIAGALRHLPAIRRGLGGGDAPVMVDLQRTEYLPIAWALGRPFVQTLHYSAAQNTGPMEGFRGKLSRLTEALDVAAFVTARQVNCVTTAQAEFYRQRHPILARWMKFDLLRPSVPADLFSRAPLPEPPVRFAFVGRLQEIKNPALLFAADLARDLGAARVGLVAPYLPYMRQDHRFDPGEALTSRTFARWLSGHFDWMLTVDPHLHRYGSLDEIYSIETRIVPAAPLLADWIQARVEQPVIVGPDAESRQWVEAVAACRDLPWRVMEKSRHGDRDVTVSGEGLSELCDRRPVLVDDIASSGATLAEAAGVLTAAGTEAPVCAVVHGLIGEGCRRRLAEAGIAELACTDSVDVAEAAIPLAEELAPHVRELAEERRRGRQRR